jgi:hypothetical protein
LWDVKDNCYSSFDSSREFYTWLWKEYEQLKILPMPDEVVPLNKERYEGLIEKVRSLGWPPGDTSGWKREEGMKEVKKIGPGYHYGWGASPQMRR